MTINQKLEKVYGNTIEMNQLWIMMELLIISLLIVLRLNLTKITGSAGNDGTKAVQKMVPLKYLSSFCRPLKMPLINC